MSTDKLLMKLMNKTPLETRQVIWKGDLIPEYFIRNDGIVFHHGVTLKSHIMSGHNYASIYWNGKHCEYRIDYMVAYAFLGMRDDAIRLIHINEDPFDDRIGNLLWYRKCDIIDKYKDLAIIEPDGSIKEEWRPCITEHNPDLHYMVNNFGLIKDSHGRYIDIHLNHGYRMFYYIDAKYAKQTRCKSVHRAVAEAFIPNPNNYELVNHLDGDTTNDVVVNLEWATNGMNAEHAYLQHLNVSARYTTQQIDTVCKLLCDSVPHVKIANITGVDRKTISDIYRGRRWESISKNYKFPGRKWTPELKETICNMIISGKKGAEIFSDLNIEYDQSAISFYERMRRELKSQGKI